MIIVLLLIVIAFLYAINRKQQPELTWQERHKRLRRNVLICASIAGAFYLLDIARHMYP